jgi:hypothetical protein
VRIVEGKEALESPEDDIKPKTIEEAADEPLPPPPAEPIAA